MSLKLSSAWWWTLAAVAGLLVFVLILLRVVIRISRSWAAMMQRRIDDAIKERAHSKDVFLRENGYTWDVVIIFKVWHISTTLTPKQEMFSLKMIVQRLSDAGLQTRLFYSVQHDEVYCKIRAPMSRLCKEAERTGMVLQLESAVVANLLQVGNHDPQLPRETHWGPISLPFSNIETTIGPYEYLYALFSSKWGERHLYKTNTSLGETRCFLRSMDRLKLISGIIAANVQDGGCGLDVYMLTKEQCILGMFGIHDRVELRTLEQKWLVLFQLPSQQKVDLVRDYFGEKIAFYFVFLGEYTSWLFWASVAGCIVFIDVCIENGDANSVLTPYFAVFMALWSTLFLESFKRTQSRRAMMWGMTKIEESMSPRPEFIADPSVTSDHPHPVDGSLYYYYPREEDRKRKAISVSVSVFFIMVVIAAVVGMFSAKFVLASSSDTSVASAAGIIASLINAVQIQVMGMIYAEISLLLNKYENHRTDTVYEDALIAKSFVIQFVNSFSSMFFIAFGQMFLADVFSVVPFCTGDRRPGGCMKVLQTTMGVLFLTNLAVGSTMSVLTPYIKKRFKEEVEFKDASEGKEEASDLEHQYMLLDYHPVNGSFSDYSVLVVQFAYSTMFISAYPLASVLAFVNNYVMQRLNAWKFCQMTRRPEPRNASDIGSWLIILEIISYIAVFVSAGLVAYTGNYAVNSSWTARAWIFIGMSAGIILVKIIVPLVIPDVSREVEIQLERQSYIVDKIFNNVPDEVEAVFVKRGGSGVNMSVDIRITDDDPL
jgi:anoctamin-10/anoctamin-7